MKKSFYLLFLVIFFSCSSKKDVTYLNDIKSSQNWYAKPTKSFSNIIQPGDILKIEIKSTVPEASSIYNLNDYSKNVSDQLLKYSSYVVNDSSNILLPVLGYIDLRGLNIYEAENLITKLLKDGQHLKNPLVKINQLNLNFTVLGEVKAPGTYVCENNILNIFQALGYAGDLTVFGKKNDIILIRENNGIKKTYKVSLTNSQIFSKPYYYVNNNDVIIVNPTFSRVKSFGFIGSPSSITSISSLLLSITLLIINR